MRREDSMLYAFDIGELLRVLVENCPNEAVGLFFATYGTFIITFILIVVVLIRFIKKTGLNEKGTDNRIANLADTLSLIINNATDTALENAKVSGEIKDEIKANNNTVLQLLIAFGIANGMSYTDIKNIIDSSRSIYESSKKQYDALLEEADDRELEAKKKNEQAEQEIKDAALKKNEALSRLKIGE